MIRRILVPLDGSPRSESVLPTAANIAAKLGAELQIAMVHVPGVYVVDQPSDEFDRDAIAQGRNYLDTVTARVRAKFPGPLKVHLLEGLAPETLATEAVAQEIDLLVMNAHGWGFVSRSILGSVSDYLMQHIRIPMLLMHSDPAAVESSQPVQFDRILVGLDGSPLAEQVLQSAVAMGEIWQSELRLLRVISPIAHSLESFNAERRQQYNSIYDKAGAEAKAYLQQVAARIKSDSLTVATNVVLRQDPAAAILRESQVAQCDLIAISTHGRGGLARLVMGSVSDKVIRGAETPVLVYHPPDN